MFHFFFRGAFLLFLFLMWIDCVCTWCRISEKCVHTRKTSAGMNAYIFRLEFCANRQKKIGEFISELMTGVCQCYQCICECFCSLHYQLYPQNACHCPPKCIIHHPSFKKNCKHIYKMTILTFATVSENSVFLMVLWCAVLLGENL